MLRLGVLFSLEGTGDLKYPGGAKVGTCPRLGRRALGAQGGSGEVYQKTLVPTGSGFFVGVINWIARYIGYSVAKIKYAMGLFAQCHCIGRSANPMNGGGKHHPLGTRQGRRGCARPTFDGQGAFASVLRVGAPCSDAQIGEFRTDFRVSATPRYVTHRAGFDESGQLGRLAAYCFNSGSMINLFRRPRNSPNSGPPFRG